LPAIDAASTGKGGCLGRGAQGKRSSTAVCVCDFTAAFELSQPTISHHMAKLREAGLVEVTKVGIWAYYRLSARLDAKAHALLDVLV
jgi:ArsR family transcriptional regulator, arsenate/arsenite/antimonite-responsive transcriptional repressor